MFDPIWEMLIVLIKLLTLEFSKILRVYLFKTANTLLMERMGKSLAPIFGCSSETV